MAYDIILSPESLDDLEDMYSYIALAGNPLNGARFVEKILSFCEELTTFPRRGTDRSNVAHGLRTTSYKGQVTIVFLVEDERKMVTIVRIFHGRRNIEKALKKLRESDANSNE